MSKAIEKLKSLLEKVPVEISIEILVEIHLLLEKGNKAAFEKGHKVGYKEGQENALEYTSHNNPLS